MLVQKQLLARLLILLCSTPINSLKILFPSPCHTGHLAPSSGIVRALLARGHDVDIFMGDDCCETKAKKAFGNFSNCFHAPILVAQGVLANNQIQGLLHVKETFADNSTLFAFKVFDEFLRSHADDYDVVVHDYLFFGANLAARKHKIPTVAHFVGPAPYILADEPEKHLSLIYLPETKLPHFAVSFLEFVSIVIWQKVASEKIYEYVTKIESEIGMEPLLKNSGITYALPFSYYYMFTPLIHMGPPDVFLPYPDFMNHKNNIRHVGFVPDETCFGVVDPEIDAFINRATTPVVYLSLGTVFNMEITGLERTLDQFASQNKYSIIWSASALCYEELKAKNVQSEYLMLVTKVAQLSLLMHEQVKVFITHAGANSLQEGIYSETPMLVFPGFGDQPLNARKLVESGLALPLVDLSFEEVSKKLGMVLEPRQYATKKDAMRRSKQGMTSLGGYKKAAETVEQVYKGTFKVIDPPKLLDLEKRMWMQMYWYGALCLSFLGCIFILMFRICCRRQKTKKE